MNSLETSITALRGLHLAYLDPGSGAILIQMLLAGVAGIGLFLKYQGRRILRLIGFKGKHPADDANEN